MDWWLIFAVFLFFASAALIIAEVFVPSGGIITAFSLVCVIGGIWIFFRHSTAMGWVGIATAIIMIPKIVVVAYKMFPRTGFGKTVTLTPPQREAGDAIRDTSELKQLLGAGGAVNTTLRPAGICDSLGQRVESIAASGYVAKDKKVKVIHVEATQLTVRVIEES